MRRKGLPASLSSPEAARQLATNGWGRAEEVGAAEVKPREGWGGETLAGWRASFRSRREQQREEKQDPNSAQKERASQASAFRRPTKPTTPRQGLKAAFLLQRRRGCQADARPVSFACCGCGWRARGSGEAGQTRSFVGTRVCLLFLDVRGDAAYLDGRTFWSPLLWGAKWGVGKRRSRPSEAVLALPGRPLRLSPPTPSSSAWKDGRGDGGEP